MNVRILFRYGRESKRNTELSEHSYHIAISNIKIITRFGYWYSPLQPRGKYSLLTLFTHRRVYIAICSLLLLDELQRSIVRLVAFYELHKSSHHHLVFLFSA